MSFCQQEIVDVDKFAQSLNAFFNKSYTEKIANIRGLGNELYTLIKRLLEGIKNLQNYSSIKNQANTLYARLSGCFSIFASHHASSSATVAILISIIFSFVSFCM